MSRGIGRVQAQKLGSKGSARQRGNFPYIVGRRYFHNIHADQVDPGKATDGLQRLVSRQTPAHRRPGSRCITRVQAVDVESQVDFVVTHDSFHLGRHGIAIEDEGDGAVVDQ